MHPKRVGDGDAFVGVFLIYGFDFFHEQKQGKAAFGVAVDDGDESRVFAKEQAEVIATDTAIGGIAGFVWPGPFVVKAHDVAVVVQGFAEVADGKVDGGFDEFPDGGGAHEVVEWLREVRKSCRGRRRCSGKGGERDVS